MKLRSRVTFSERVQVDGPGGVVTTQWVQRGTVWAEVIHLRGGETVMAGRLQGRHTQVFRIRQSPLSLSITPSWKATADGVDFNIRDVTSDPYRRFDSVLCESGVAP